MKKKKRTNDWIFNLYVIFQKKYTILFCWVNLPKSKKLIFMFASAAVDTNNNFSGLKFLFDRFYNFEQSKYYSFVN